MYVTGIVTDIVDCGSIVQVYIDGVPFAADTNQWYRNGAADNIDEGTEVEATVEGWGGLLSIQPV